MALIVQKFGGSSVAELGDLNHDERVTFLAPHLLCKCGSATMGVLARSDFWELPI